MLALHSEKALICEPFVEVHYLEDVKEQQVLGTSIIVNCSEKEAVVAGLPLQPWESSVFVSATINKGENLLCMIPKLGLFSCEHFPYAAKVQKAWKHVYELFHLRHLRKIQLWRSEKSKASNMELNLWFANAGTDCGIHNEHSFRELHTQIFGVGRMQKYHSENKDSLFQEIYMSPGFTHDPFYDDKCDYPWHQYHADTDCIWLAIEF